MRRRNILTATFMVAVLSVNCWGGKTTPNHSLDNVIDELASRPCYVAKVKYEVQLPTSSEPVDYDISLTSSLAEGDTLSPCNYVITWQLPRGRNVSTGFSSYSNGDHFRYRDTRLQEYHFDDDPVPFSAAGGGVQRTAQFADLLPQNIALQLKSMLTDTTFVYTFNEKTITLSGVQRIGGYDAIEYTYKFDAATMMPAQIDMVYNPASISEQVVSAVFTETPGTDCPEINEAYLVEQFPEEFGKYRTSNFRVENLKDTFFPTFSYASSLMPGADRITHTRGQADIGATAVVACLDTGVASTHGTIADIREAISQVPKSVYTVYLFTGDNLPDGFELQANEYIAHRADALFTKLGVNAYPTLIIVDSTGKVSQINIGQDKDFTDTLPQTLLITL